MYISLDIGGSKGRIALFTGLKKESLVNIVYLPIGDNFEMDIEKIFLGIDSLCMGKKLDGIAVGVAGSVNEKHSGIINSANLKSWEGKNLTLKFASKYGCKVVVRNDTFMAGIAESVYEKISEDFLYINWGTGIGGSLINFIEEGKVDIRPTELGHQIIDSKGKTKCHCGQTGCLDSLVGGKSIEKIYNKKAANLDLAEWDEILNIFAIGIINALVVYPVKYVVIGGGIAINQKERIKKLEKLIGEKLKIIQDPKIKITSMNDHGALYGGLLMLQKIG